MNFHDLSSDWDNKALGAWPAVQMIQYQWDGHALRSKITWHCSCLSNWKNSNLLYRIYQRPVICNTQCISQSLKNVLIEQELSKVQRDKAYKTIYLYFKFRSEWFYRVSLYLVYLFFYRYFYRNWEVLDISSVKLREKKLFLENRLYRKNSQNSFILIIPRRKKKT